MAEIFDEFYGRDDEDDEDGAKNIIADPRAEILFLISVAILYVFVSIELLGVADWLT